MAATFAKFAALGLAVAAGTVALVEIPFTSRAAAASPALVEPARVQEARLPESVAPRPRLVPGTDAARERKPADACADQVWPYISPACASRDDGRPMRKVRVITGQEVASLPVPAPAAIAPPAPTIPAVPAAPARKPGRSATKTAALR